MTIKEKVSYLKGMMDGMNFEADTSEKKLIAAVVEVLDMLADELEATQEDCNYISDYVEELDEDLGDLEEFVYSEAEEYDEEYDDDYDDDDLCEMECDCGSFVEISDENIKEGKIVCPDCGKSYDLSEICGNCDGCCGE